MTASETAAKRTTTSAPEPLAFTPDPASASASQILNNVVPVLDMLAALFDDTDQTVDLPPLAAKGLHTVLAAARHDVAVALEMR